MASKFLNLRFKFGGKLVSEVGPVYIGGRTEYVFNVDEDHLSIPEVSDYAKTFGITKLGKTYVVASKGGDMIELIKDRDIYDIALYLHSGDTIDIYVCEDSIVEEVGPHGGQNSQVTSETYNAPLAASKESFTTFETCGSSHIQDLGLTSCKVAVHSSERVENEGVGDDDDYSSIDWTDTDEEVEPSVQQEAQPSVQEEGNLNDEEDVVVNEDEDSDHSIDYESNVHEELRIVKENVKKFNRKNRRNKKKEKSKGFLGEVGIDEGYDDIDKGKKNFKGKLTKDEPYYDSSDCDSFDSDEELHWKKN